MTVDEFNDTIDFAVEREKEAVAFYADLQTKARFSAQKIMLKELESMEKGHVLMLEELRRLGSDFVIEHPHKEVTNLKISDYLVESQPSDKMTYQDILIIAMKREERSHALYTDLATQFAGSGAESILQRLAAEEGDHKNRFEKLYDEEILKGN
jgi:rubrerythrin